MHRPAIALDPGRMDVPPLFGWGHILTVLAVMVAVAVVFFVVSALGSSADGRGEWQAWLDARSGGYRDPAAGTPDRSAEPIRPGSGVPRQGSGEDAAAVHDI